MRSIFNHSIAFLVNDRKEKRADSDEDCVTSSKVIAMLSLGIFCTTNNYGTSFLHSYLTQQKLPSPGK
eukprot:scaffold1491_cov167-Ochromonas_danica.AAC.8